MKPLANFKSVFLWAMLVFFATPLFSQTSIIPYGSNWKYLDNGSNQGIAWRAPGFNDVGWSSGVAELGYGDAPATMVSYGPDANNKYITTYFRKQISIVNPATFTNFILNIRRDDGVAVYINGIERYRNNLAAAATYTTLATLAADDGAIPQTTTLASSVFVAGVNTIAVEIHQTAVNSSDITFDLELLGNMPAARVINFGDAWKYLDNNTRPAGWETIGFNDASWSSGPSSLGYGDAQVTQVSYGPDASNKYVSTYFRKSFTITGLSNYIHFTMNVVRDDGVIVYVNGNEVARNNMAGGAPAHNTLASVDITGTAETAPVSFTLPTCVFVEGTNTIAVEIHQNHLTSADISLNLELIANGGGSIPALSRGPYLQKGTQTAITIRWRTDVACYGRVKLGSSNGIYTTATIDETCSGTEHIVTVNGLNPDTKYFYQISAADGTVFQSGSANFFRTNPPANTARKIRIVAFGDCGRGNASYQDENLANYQNYLTANGMDAPDAWILLGDNAYNFGTDAEYTNNFFGIYGSNILKNHKLYPTPDNHDYGNASANKASRSMPYHSIFSVPQSGEAGGVASNKQNYYSYDIGNIHFLSLDSYGTEADLTSMHTSGASALKTWIDADLAANTQKWIVAYWHHPPYTKSNHDSDIESDLIAIRQNFITYLESRGVDLVINGHAHAYERGYILRNFTGDWASFTPASHAVSTSSAKYDGTANSCPYVYNSSPANHGAVYVVAGSTGASGGIRSAFGANAFPFAVNDGGVFYFEVEDNRLDAKMLRRNGTVFDQFTIMKDAGVRQNYNVFVNSPVTLAASWPDSINNYSWNTGANTRAINFTPTTAGITNFTVSDNYGCITDQFTVTAVGTLPVSLLNFEASLTSTNKVNLNWTTVTESNSKIFSIERSPNGNDFVVIGTVNAAGNSTNLRDYAFTDESPLAGTSYYRLSQTDFDNHREHLGTRRIMNVVKELEVKTVSTSNGRLVLQFNSTKQLNIRLRVYDISGGERLNEKLNLSAGLTNKEIFLNNGMYIWELRNERGEVTFQKIVIH